MNLAEIVGLLHEVGICMQQALLLVSQGRHEEAAEIGRRTAVLKRQCGEKNIDICFFSEYLYPLHDGQSMSLTPPPLRRWPLPQSEDKKTVHAHITIIYKLLFRGHPEMTASGFRIQIMNDLEGNTETPPPPTMEKKHLAQTLRAGSFLPTKPVNS